MSLLKTLRFITTHPMNRDRPLSAIGRFVKWQIQCRLQNEVIHDWIGGSKLAVRKGMTGATGNVYCGLHEYVDMSFVLHVLRPGDLFVDVGANVGSYTVLAAAVAGANVIAFEPDPDTARYLKRNVEINNIADRVEIHECALGDENGSILFTVGRDTVNKVASSTDVNTRLVRIEQLDTILNGREPTLIKLDVEGWESQVLAGAKGALKSRQLLAVETEDNSPDVRRQLNESSFHQSFYDPIGRALHAVPNFKTNNVLFVRSHAAVLDRTASSR